VPRPSASWRVGVDGAEAEKLLTGRGERSRF
jgi:hypothetical protein